MKTDHSLVSASQTIIPQLSRSSSCFFGGGFFLTLNITVGVEYKFALMLGD